MLIKTNTEIKKMKTYTIIDLATDKEYTGAIPELLDMVDDCNNTTLENYDIVVERKLAKSIRINFHKFLQLNFNKIQGVV